MKDKQQERHQPNPEFVDRLEWQLMTEMRQSERSFHQPQSKSSTWRRYLRVAALVVVSALGGIALLKAAQGLEQNWQHQLELARAETEARLASSQLELAEAYFEKVQEQAAVGLVDQDSLAWAEFEMTQVAQRLRMTQLDLEEMELSGRSPRHELYAPLVSGTDFVTRRLHIEMEIMQQKLQLAQRMLDGRRKRVETGVASRETLASAENDLQQVRLEVQDVAQKLELRQRFLNGRLTPEQVMAESRLSGVEARVQHLRKRVEFGQGHMERLRNRVQAGAAEELELQHAEYEFERIKSELRLAELELELLREHAAR